MRFFFFRRTPKVLGSWRPWCPPAFIKKFREKFPNGLSVPNAGGVLQYDDFQEVMDEIGVEGLQVPYALLRTCS